MSEDMIGGNFHIGIYYWSGRSYLYCWEISPYSDTKIHSLKECMRFINELEVKMKTLKYIILVLCLSFSAVWAGDVEHGNTNQLNRCIPQQ